MDILFVLHSFFSCISTPIWDFLGHKDLKEKYKKSLISNTVASKCFEYQFLATLDERGQGNHNDGDKRGGRKGYECDQNHDLIERWFHCGVCVFKDLEASKFSLVVLRFWFCPGYVLIWTILDILRLFKGHRWQSYQQRKLTKIIWKWI